LEGGADTGFHHVEPEKYTPRLMHFSGKGKKVVVTQVSCDFLSHSSAYTRESADSAEK